jgi:hypothetical protein
MNTTAQLPHHTPADLPPPHPVAARCTPLMQPDMPDSPDDENSWYNAESHAYDRCSQDRTRLSTSHVQAIRMPAVATSA